MRKIVLVIATGAGSGYSPFASGTVGSVVGLVLWLPISGLAPLAYALAVGVVIALGVWAAHRAQAIFRTHDDGRITVDEVAGQLVALAFLPPTLPVVALGFFLFRLFDVWKPPPARQLERLPGGFGVMADDLAAGVYANLVGQLIWRGLYAASSGG